MRTPTPNPTYCLHEVVVEPTDENYVYQPFDSDTIKGPVREWLRENVAHGWTWEMEKVRERGNRALLVFRFTNPEEACAFRMVWG